MRILQVLPTLSAGGAEAFVANLCVSLAQAGAEPQLHLLSTVRDERGELLYEKLRDNGVKVSGNTYGSIRNWRVPIEFLRAANAFRPDYVQANLHSSEVIVTATNRFIQSKPKLIRRLANSRSLGLSNRLALRWIDRRFHLTVACSETVRYYYDRELKTSHDCEIVTILNGSVLRSAPPTDAEKAAARTALGIDNDVRVFANIGAMRPVSRNDTSLEGAQKAHDVLITAFSRAFGATPRAILLLVGDGPLRGPLETLAASLGIADQVRFLGMLPEPWLALEAADIFVFPSRFEGHPNVLPEAISCGLPLLISDIRENRDMLFGAPHRAVAVDDVDAFARAMVDLDQVFHSLKAQAAATAPIVLTQKSMDSCAAAYISAFGSIGHHPQFSGTDRR